MTKTDETHNNNNNNSNNKSFEVKVISTVVGRTNNIKFTAQDYYNIYRNLKEDTENGNKKSKGVQRKSSFSALSPKDQPTSSSGLSRSKSFAAYSIQNRRNPSPIENIGHERLSDKESEICDKAKMDIMLEQTNKRPPEIKVTGGIAER